MDEQRIDAFVELLSSLDERLSALVTKSGTLYSLENAYEHGGRMWEDSLLVLKVDSLDAIEQLKKFGGILNSDAEAAGFDAMFLEGPNRINIFLGEVDAPSREQLNAMVDQLDHVLAQVIPINERFVSALDVPTRVVDGFEMNRLEEVFYEMLKRSNLLFSPQCRIVYEGRIKNRFDFLVLYRGRAFRVEIDGYDAHTTREAHTKDRATDRFYEARGVGVIRFSASEVHKDVEACWLDLVARITGEPGGVVS